MTRARVRPLLVLLAGLGVALVARLFQVQVDQHALWAQEASRLLLEGHEEPYRRGRILDRNGVVLARDEEQRAVELVYRQFRREHPLGQVAHARSLVEGRPVPLADARAHLAEWALELVELGPAELRAFGRGEFDVPGARTSDPRVAAQRAADLLFYVRGLLDLDRREDGGRWKALLELLREEGEVRSLVELAAVVRGHADAEGVARERRELETRLAHSLERLGVLARWLHAPEEGGDPLELFVAELEDARRTVEDATAAKLFAEATGFAPGRIEPDTLLVCFDLAWIRDLLVWDAARAGEWARDVRAAWLGRWRDEACLPQLLWKLIHDPSAAPTPADFVASVAVVWRPEGALAEALDGRATPWREIDELAVLTELDALFEADVPDSARALAAGALPILLPELRADADDLRLLPEGAGAGSFRDLLALALAGSGRNELETLLELAVNLADGWERRFQETLRQALDEIRRAAARDELGPGRGLRMAEESRQRAAERAEYLLKDYGSRARPMGRAPGRGGTGGGVELTYDVVYLLTRYEADFPGFRVRKLERRATLEQPGDDRVPAEFLLGRVQQPALEDLLRQRREAARLRELKDLADRAVGEEEELRRLIGTVRLPGEVKGVEGVEGFFEPELTGSNGFYQTRGASDVFGPDGDDLRVRDPVDGRDVVLTLDVGCQTASQRSLRDPDAEHVDKAWMRNPVGAIVLLDEEGNVLAAASEPDLDSVLDPAALGERQVAAERTLTKRTFQPPGSCFKVFVAAYALEHGLDPSSRVTCAPLPNGGAGYRDLRCWNKTGHGSLDLAGALVQSCNAYFAWLGEQLSTAEFAELCDLFGFGEPTGVRRAPPWDDGLGRRRSGLREDVAGLALPRGGGELGIEDRRRVANGLGRIEATPMQVARGMLALSRGELVELRFAARVGERELPLGAREPLALGADSLEFVRRAMRGVAADASGTAHRALSLDQLGFRVAVKTGSADLVGRGERNKVRKHAWVAGWVPADDPELVFVVFEHDTEETSSNGAVFLARQLLQQPEVLAYLAEQGVDVSGVPPR